MTRKEKTWRILEIVVGALGAALLIAILVLRILKHEILFLSYPLVGAVILFLLCDERARMLKRKRLPEDQKETKEAQQPSEDAMPKEAFEFDEKQP